eukprot:scaffold9062_cov34-Phaeocystis_antarctica.AAC.2
MAPGLPWLCVSRVAFEATGAWSFQPPTYWVSLGVHRRWTPPEFRLENLRHALGHLGSEPRPPRRLDLVGVRRPHHASTVPALLDESGCGYIDLHALPDAVSSLLPGLEAHDDLLLGNAAVDKVLQHLFVVEREPRCVIGHNIHRVDAASDARPKLFTLVVGRERLVRSLAPLLEVVERAVRRHERIEASRPRDLQVGHAVRCDLIQISQRRFKKRRGIHIGILVVLLLQRIAAGNH